MDKDKKEIELIVEDYLRRNQFGISPIQAHTHNGTDSLPIQENNIIGTTLRIIDIQNQGTASIFAVNHAVFTNDNISGNYKLIAVTASFSVASASGTLQVEVCGDTVAIGGGTSQLTLALSLSGAANTAVYGTIIPNPTAIIKSSKVNLIYAGTITGLTNASIVLTLKKTG